MTKSSIENHRMAFIFSLFYFVSFLFSINPFREMLLRASSPARARCLCVDGVVMVIPFSFLAPRVSAGASIEDICDTEESEILLVVLNGDDKDEEEDEHGGGGNDDRRRMRDELGDVATEAISQCDPSSSSCSVGGGVEGDPPSPYSSPSKSDRHRRQQHRRRRAWETNHPIVVVTSLEPDCNSKGVDELVISEYDYSNDSFEEDADDGEEKPVCNKSQMS